MRFLLAFLLVIPLVGQLPIPGPAEPAEKKEPEDPLGRQTPRSAITGFLRAAQGGNYHTAAEYLQVPPSRRSTQGVKLAQELEVVLDKGYRFPLSLFSNKPEGAVEDGVAPEQDRMGEIHIEDESADLVMVRVKDAKAGDIWLVSSETLGKVPMLSSKVTGYEFIESLPPALQKKFLGLAWGQWLGTIVLAFVAYALAWILVGLLNLILRAAKIRMTKPPRGGVVLLAVLIHAPLMELLALPLLYRSYYRRLVWVLFLIGFAWLTLRGIDRISERLRMNALAAGQIAKGSWVVLGRRIVKALVGLAFVLVILSALNFNLSTALAGLGIGGIAVALSAQKTIENLFGGVSVASDEVIRVGDTLRLGTTVGSVIDIGLRSTRIRTIERTELSIPNGALATMNVENLSLRDKILFNTTLDLIYETTSDQLQGVLQETRELLTQDPRVETDGFRVRFTGFGESSLKVDIWSYILTTDFNKFNEIREELLFGIMKIVENSGSGFAFPSRTVYIADGKSGNDLTSGENQDSGAKPALPTHSDAP